MANHDQTTSVT